MEGRFAPGRAKRKKERIGDYILIKQIGVGSTCTVHLARHADTKQKAALKVLSKENASEDMMRRAHLEVDLMRSLDHPGVVKVLDAIETPTQFIVALEYLNGGELFNQVDTYGAMTEPFARHIFRLVVDALTYVHSQGVAHRDLKLENLLLDKGLTACKIADFGLSALTAAAGADDKGRAQLMTVCGTPHYCAPEVFDTSSPGYDGFKADVWSLGVCLYIMITGEFPFGGKKVKEVLAAVGTGVVTYPAYMSKPCKQLLQAIFVKDPARRVPLEAIAVSPWLTNGEGATELPSGQASVLPPSAAAAPGAKRYLSGGLSSVSLLSTTTVGGGGGGGDGGADSGSLSMSWSSDDDDEWEIVHATFVDGAGGRRGGGGDGDGAQTGGIEGGGPAAPAAPAAGKGKQGEDTPVSVYTTPAERAERSDSSSSLGSVSPTTPAAGAGPAATFADLPMGPPPM